MGMGLLAHFLKSSVESESPIESMRTPTPASNWLVVIQLREVGWKKAIVPEMRAQSGKQRVAMSSTFCSVVVVGGVVVGKSLLEALVVVWVGRWMGDWRCVGRDS